MKIIKTDCIYFKGDIPCYYHKKFGKLCKCKYYKKIDKRILIIKLGAGGDVIRTTPILRKLNQLYPNCEITWISYFPDLIPKIVNNILPLNSKNILLLQADSFDILYNFDKDKIACALANTISAKIKRGFKLMRGKTAPFDKMSRYKFFTGLDDTLNRRNKLSYQQEIFNIAGFKFKGEKYIIDEPSNISIPHTIKTPIIGLNTGCGDRWKTRNWSTSNWISLAKSLKKMGFGVLLIGGEAEHKKNLMIKKKSKVHYLGHFSLSKFIRIVNQCDLIVTPVTMALHIAIGLNKKVIALNNIFNRNEFELYNLGKIIEPVMPCLGCFSQNCAKKCIDKITPARIIKEINLLLNNG